MDYNSPNSVEMTPTPTQAVAVAVRQLGEDLCCTAQTAGGQDGGFGCLLLALQ